MLSTPKLHSHELEAELRQHELAKHGSYDKRTEHLNEEGYGTFINRLIREDSPYLLQHAHNPVNWFAWGDEAFAQAREQNKPVFLSIGYATCHWCHVMEVESFDNPAVAAVLNEHFISVKMDREQYPDVDEVYMTGVQLMTGHGGWPMSNLLLPTGEPFFGATYFPAAQFIAILDQVVIAWRDKREELEASAKQMQQGIEKILGNRQTVEALDDNLLKNSVQALMQREDRERGGLAGEPKFPQEPLLLLLLDAAAHERDDHALGFVDRALEGMARGGIFDQVAGGFARYSVDEDWLVPHFEKMLYNQSQLGAVALQAYRLTQKPFFHRVLLQTLNYVLRDMQRPEGGFYSATDADSEGEEGVFFTWSLAQLEAVLDADDFEFVKQLYGPSQLGNFEGSNILCLSRSLEVSAKEYGEGFYARLDAILLTLYEAREQRIHPLLDDKLIVAWSAGMAATLAAAGAELGESRFSIAARTAVECMWSEAVNAQGRLQRISLNGTVSIAAQLEDYAQLITAMIALFDANPAESLWLTRARQLANTMIEEFWDAQEAGFYLSPAQQVGPQLTRSKSASDGATLSPVAAALGCLKALDERRILPDQNVETSDYDGLLQQGLAAVSGQLNEHPLSHPSLLRLHEALERRGGERLVYLQGGLARLELRRGAQRDANTLEAHLSFTLQPGWHIDGPAATDSVSRSLEIMSDENSVWQLTSRLPAEVAQFKGETEISLTFTRAPQDAAALNQSLGLKLGVQLCSESECLLYEEIDLTA